MGKRKIKKYSASKAHSVAKKVKFAPIEKVINKSISPKNTAGIDFSLFSKKTTQDQTIELIKQPQKAKNQELDKIPVLATKMSQLREKINDVKLKLVAIQGSTNMEQDDNALEGNAEKVTFSEEERACFLDLFAEEIINYDTISKLAAETSQLSEEIDDAKLNLGAFIESTSLNATAEATELVAMRQVGASPQNLDLSPMGDLDLELFNY